MPATAPRIEPRDRAGNDSTPVEPAEITTADVTGKDHAPAGQVEGAYISPSLHSAPLPPGGSSELGASGARTSDQPRATAANPPQVRRPSPQKRTSQPYPVTAPSSAQEKLWFVGLGIAAVLVPVIGIASFERNGEQPPSPQEQSWTQRWENSGVPFRGAQFDQWNADPETYLDIGPAALGQPNDLVRRMMNQSC